MSPRHDANRSSEAPKRGPVVPSVEDERQHVARLLGRILARRWLCGMDRGVPFGHRPAAGSDRA
jgi:hypothetical protein